MNSPKSTNISTVIEQEGVRGRSEDEYMGVLLLVKSDPKQYGTLIEFCCFNFNSSSSRCLNGQFNCCLLVSSITVTPKTKTNQDASAWETEGLVLTDVGSDKSYGFDS